MRINFSSSVAPTPVRMTGLNDYVLESDEVSVDCVVDKVKPANVTFTWTLGANILDTHKQTITENGDKTFRVASRLKRSFLRRDDLEEPLRCEVTHGVDRSLKSQDEKKVVVYCKILHCIIKIVFIHIGCSYYFLCIFIRINGMPTSKENYRYSYFQ